MKTNRAGWSLPGNKQRRTRRKGVNLRLESLETRNLLTTLDVETVDPIGDEGGTDGGVDEPVVVSPIEIDITQDAIERAWVRVSDLSQYSDEQLSQVTTWVLRLNEGVDEDRLERQIGAQVEPISYSPNTYSFEIDQYETFSSDTATFTADIFSRLAIIDKHFPLVVSPRERHLIPNDPFFPEQWHLDNTGQTGGTVGEDANVIETWDNYTGTGVVIGVVDDGVEAHPDLPLRADLSFDFAQNIPGSTPGLPGDSHGTSVAGVAAAIGNNAQGVTGVAFGAEVAGLRLEFGSPNFDLQQAASYAFETQEIDIYNSSLGTTFYFQENPLILTALENGLATGRGGLGSIHVSSAGNDALVGDNANYSTFQSHPGVITVGAVGHNGIKADYSNPGANVFVAAPSEGTSALDGIFTTDRLGALGSNTVADASDGDDAPDLDYTSIFSGTSSAAPVVSGVIALMLEANPNLTYRDVQHILAESARMNDAGDADWVTNAAGFEVNHKYGFGVVDAEAAVSLADVWVNVGPEITQSTGLITTNLAIPENDPVGVDVTFDVTEDMNLEWVELTANITHTYSGDLEVTLTSPTGITSVLSETNIFNTGNVDGHTWSTVHNWGESPVGTWTLHVHDGLALDTGTLDAFTVTLRGTAIEDTPVDTDEPTSISGIVYHDMDGDLLRDIGEDDGVEGVWVYVDLDDDGMLSVNDRASITDRFGRYEILDIPAGTHDVRAIVDPGWVLLSPPGGFYQDVVVNDGDVLTGYDFGMELGLDFGDAPAPFPTLLADDGPVHGILAGFHLGSATEDGGFGVDSEDDGFQSAGETDDLNGVDDEDGVRITRQFTPGEVAELEITVSTGGFAPGFLNAWIDFNGDGAWDASEQIADDLILASGVHTLPVSVPATAVGGLTHGRFRYSQQANVGVTGRATSGEVEDHPIAILGNDAIALDDFYDVPVDATDYPLPVTENDFPSVNGTPGELIIQLDSTVSAAGGQLSLDTGGTIFDTTDDVVRYTPPADFGGVDTFSYRVIDSVGSTDTATVTLNVTLADGPVAVDNIFRVPQNSTARTLDVLANDLAGANGGLTIASFASGTSGTVGLSSDSAFLTYTPNTGFEGVDQFAYTVRDSEGLLSTAEVTVVVGDASADDAMSIFFELVDTSGAPITGNLEVGQTFRINAYADDIRTGFPQPGVFSSYFDLLYSSHLISLVDGPNFADDFNVQRVGQTTTEGIINESGAARGESFPGAPPNITAPQLVYSADFVANGVGLATIEADPADVLPAHDSLFYRPVPETPLTVDEIDFGFLDLPIFPAANLLDVHVEIRDMSDMPIDTIVEGETFKVAVLAEDLRSVPLAEQGVFSFYTDLFFDASRATPGDGGPLASAITFSSFYPSGQNALFGTGLIDEVGAIRSEVNAPPVGGALGGGDPIQIFEIVFTATAPGVLSFRADPADQLPLREVLFQSPITTVPTNRIDYGQDEVVVLSSGSGTQTTQSNNDNDIDISNLDVNKDGMVSSLDVLTLINAINSQSFVGAVGEGEAAAVDAINLDVSGDTELTAVDVLMVINYINANGNGTIVGSGEAESAPDVVLGTLESDAWYRNPTASKDEVADAIEEADTDALDEIFANWA